MSIYGDCFGNSGVYKAYVCYNTTYDGKGVWLNASGNITISSGSILDGKGLGFPKVVGPGSHDNGATYGGKGGQNTVDSPYGNETMPTSLGSGGNNPSYGLAGGSAVKLQTDSGIVDVDGIITVVGSSNSDTSMRGSRWEYMAKGK